MPVLHNAAQLPDKLPTRPPVLTDVPNLERRSLSIVYSAEYISTCRKRYPSLNSNQVHNYYYYKELDPI